MKRRVAKFAARRPAARPATSRFDRANTNGQRIFTIAITIAITGYALTGAIILAISFFVFCVALLRLLSRIYAWLLRVLIQLKMSISARIQSCEC